MATLVVGLILFLGIHLLPAFPGVRGGLASRWGEGRYKGLFSLVSFAGLALIIIGYAKAERGDQLFAPLPAAIAVAPYAMTVAFVLFAAANMRGYLRQTLSHPMLIGAFFGYGVVDLFSAVQRHAVKTFEPVARHDVIAVIAGVVVALVLMTFHRVLFSVQVAPFGI